MLAWAAPILIPVLPQAVLLAISSEKRWVFRQAAYSLIFQVGCWISAAFFAALSNIFWFFAIPAWLMGFVGFFGMIYGAIQAWNGRLFEAPVMGSVAKALFR